MPRGFLCPFLACAGRGSFPPITPTRASEKCTLVSTTTHLIPPGPTEMLLLGGYVPIERRQHREISLDATPRLDDERLSSQRRLRQERDGRPDRRFRTRPSCIASPAMHEGRVRAPSTGGLPWRQGGPVLRARRARREPAAVDRRSRYQGERRCAPRRPVGQFLGADGEFAEGQGRGTEHSLTDKPWRCSSSHGPARLTAADGSPARQYSRPRSLEDGRVPPSPYSDHAGPVRASHPGRPSLGLRPCALPTPGACGGHRTAPC